MDDLEELEASIYPENLPRELRDALERVTVMAHALGHTLADTWVYFPENDLALFFGAPSPPCFSNTCDACNKRLFVQELPKTMEGDLYAFRGHVLSYACDPDRLDRMFDAYLMSGDV